MKFKKYKAGVVREEGVSQLNLEKADDGSFNLVVYDNKGTYDCKCLLNISKDGIRLYDCVSDSFGIALKKSDDTVKILKERAEL